VQIVPCMYVHMYSYAVLAHSNCIGMPVKLFIFKVRRAAPPRTKDTRWARLSEWVSSRSRIWPNRFPTRMWASWALGFRFRSTCGLLEANLAVMSCQQNLNSC